MGATTKILRAWLLCASALASDLRGSSDRRLARLRACSLAPALRAPPSRRVRQVRWADRIVDGWELFGLAKCGSSSLRWYIDAVLPRDGNATTLSAVAASATVTRRIAFVRDPIERFISGAMELMIARGGPKHDPNGRVDRASGTSAEDRRLHGHEARDVGASAFWREAVARFAAALVRGEVGFSKTGGMDDHLRPQAETLKRLPDLAHLGLVNTMFDELDHRFGTRASDASARLGEANRSKKLRQRQKAGTTDARVILPAQTRRELCLFYLADVCCLDSSFVETCAAVGVSCHTNGTYARRSAFRAIQGVLLR